MSKPQKITLALADIRYELDGSLDNAIAALQARKALHEADGWTDLEIDIDYRESYDCVTVEAELRGTRMETQDEAEQREQRAKRATDDAEAYARAQYEALKAKFG